MTQKQKTEYTAEKITVLKGLEAVRKRPAMYIGDIGQKGLHHLVWEVVDNCIDETLAGYCSKIIVTLMKDGWVSVEDNGRGIPVDIHKEEGKSALEVVMTVLHAGGKFDKSTYKVSGGLHGVGVSVVNALSKECEVEVCRDGKKHKQKYKIGQTSGPVDVIGKTDKTGTKISFLPDYDIFVGTKYEIKTVDNRLRELAYLNEGLEIIIKDERTKETEEIVHHYEGGLGEFVKYLDEGHKQLFEEPISIKGEKDGVPVEMSLIYNESYTENLLTFVNNNTIEGERIYQDLEQL